MKEPSSQTERVAVSIVQKLFDEGFTAYFAGGYVRDILLGLQVAEIDIATSASPEIIISLFPKTILVGVSFGVVVVLLEGESFEVTTFRKDHPYHDGRHPEGVDFSTPEKDALRRDFTINGMFYDPLTSTIYDYVEGRQDLEKKVIRAIGDPFLRFQEDRLRMIRAVRFATRLNFTIDGKTEEAIQASAKELFPAVSMERIWQELNKMRQGPHFNRAICELHRLGLLPEICNSLKNVSLETIQKWTKHFPYYPLDTPTMIFLMALFPTASLDQMLNLSETLKAPHQEKKVMEFFFRSEPLFVNSSEDALWAHFYSHLLSDLFLGVKSASLNPNEKQAFYNEHESRKKRLISHINRIQHRTPLITARMLQHEGIEPGKKLGELLREGERIAINQDLDEPKDVISQLKKSPLWQKNI